MNIFYISDVTISVTSVTSPGFAFTAIQPFGPSANSEIWTTQTWTTSVIPITVTFNAPGSTIVTTSIVATAFANTVGIGPGLTTSASSVSPITVANPSVQQYSMIVGNTWSSNAGVGCQNPSPGSGQTQILNANAFCLSNVNGGTSFLYDYDVEYFNAGTTQSYNYVTNFNGTAAGESINLQLLGGSHHDKIWAITSSNSTLYNSDEYDIPLNPSFTVNSPNGLPTSATGTVFTVCNYASANVTINFYYEIFISNAWLGLERWTFFSGNLCDGTTTHTKLTAPALSNNFLSRIRAICSTCPNGVNISIPNLVIGWVVTGQIQIRESIVSVTTTNFQVKWLASEPAPITYAVNWQWSAIGN